MSDLIERSMYKSKLIKALNVLNKEYRKAILNEDNDLILAVQSQQSAYMIALRLLDNEPTAYDIDKVVSELEKVKNKDTEIALDEAQKERCFWYAQGMNRAIKIVKGCGVDGKIDR